MSISSELNRCPKCGGPIPSEAPQGLCPKCLLREVSIATELATGAPSRSPAPTHEQLTAAFPQLEILELIGQGGMGFVFKARQPKLDRFVALKILPQSLAADPAFAERFTREGRVLARLSHPNIVAVHDFGLAGELFYLLMEFVDGVNLRQAMKIGRFTPAQALAVVPKICEALQYAHNEGILHRDIKPENILLDTRGRVKIADFGIAKLIGQPRADAPLTGSGAALGTPHYMAPEQVERPGEVDHRADIYSLGVVFYEMLTGELPLGRFAPPSQKSGADPRLDDLVFRTLAKDPGQRPQSAGDLKTQVDTIATTNGAPSLNPPETPAGRRPSPWMRMFELSSLLTSAALTLVLAIWVAFSTSRVGVHGISPGGLSLLAAMLIVTAPFALFLGASRWRRLRGANPATALPRKQIGLWIWLTLGGLLCVLTVPFLLIRASYRSVAEERETALATRSTTILEAERRKTDVAKHLATSMAAPGGLSTNLATRNFNFRHLLASQAAEETVPILLQRPGRSATYSPDNLTLTVTAPEDELRRVASLLFVTDWPAPVRNKATNQYLRDDAVSAARSFFHACSLFDPVDPSTATPLEEMLSNGVKRQMREKQITVEQLAAAWMRQPPSQLRQGGGISMTVDAKVREWVVCTFEGLPEFHELSFVREYDGYDFPNSRALPPGAKQSLFRLDTLPPALETVR